MNGFARRQALGLLASTSLLAAAPAAAKGRGGPLYKDASAPNDLRVRDLLARMTLEEKVGQIIALWATKADIMDDLTFSPAKASKAYPDGFGQITRPSDRRGVPNGSTQAGGVGARWRTPADTVAFITAVQKWATEETRLGIPVLFHEEALHGLMATEATMFPMAIGLAGSFDRQLMEEVHSVIAREVRARGVHLALSPVVDIARDPRWGRIEETFGEDPYLCAEMGVAAVRGLQGESSRIGPDKVMATLKHMTGHGQPQSGENIAPAPISERELRENFFPPFREVVKRTGIAAVMPSYNEIDGVPSHQNRWLLNDILRGEWRFDGAVVSDYGAVHELDSIHHVQPDPEAAARAALRAGVDCELPDGQTYRTLVEQVRAGKVPLEAVDLACTRMLMLKFRAGLFENPWPRKDHERLTGNAEARALALKAAHRSIVLLGNDGTLPLTPGAHRRVAVIGPNAAIARLGGYSSVPRQTVSLLEGVQAKLRGKAEVVHAQGVFITRSEDRSADEVLLADPAENRALIAQAVEVAKTADIVLLAIGDTEQTSREGFAKNHLGDRTSLDLLGEQNALFAALKATGKPVVVCAINGRPPSYPMVADGANALLECWYPGQEGGTAMADILFGDVNPGAKLPVTVARDAGQIPIFYNRKPSARRGYVFEDISPLFPFGFGLSYTHFEFGPPRLSSPRIGTGGEVTVEVDVRNAGQRAGDAVVQLYVRDQTASVTRPIRELKGFERITLAPGESRAVRMTLGPAAFALWNLDMEEVVEPGLFDVMTGPDSENLQKTTLEII
ncbi:MULTISPECIES: glycoside hydrolase family 3 N-terminal domain-containing protein [Sphingobium]|uniref:Beta-glucosidase n=1 Tax=Sphingobium fuliginis (strain ATCC 27551) TaxID=336203 RepID=A0ABQ1EWY7_SPHSA|nr:MULTISPECIES: glycoside hydrolase family 3 N-terminal domain-containing protein [Sphingobium]MCB4860343.1 glycoside hydrolase family 3 C-terminal domain-containing protein [Sphingobium sp. PNB]RYL98298.1 beta-glucosidase [Sphingobium fuliginis]WDA35419.1 glycoside hydrolase family 3 N-terminal domain-containing protein [Sphingobium sp. YC-XJ3]GFZ90292.1 beta-glucosidase [Sphingobium fuliginis]